MKKYIIIISISYILMIFIGVVTFGLFVISGGIFSCAPDPLPPKIIYSEFDFELIYEVAGEIFIIKDTIICEYDGIEDNGAAGKDYKWKLSYKSGAERITLLDVTTLNNETESKQCLSELYFFPGKAAYYMGDVWSIDYKKAQDLDESIGYIYETQEGEKNFASYSVDEVWTKYKLRLISWKCDPPIENVFPQ